MGAKYLYVSLFASVSQNPKVHKVSKFTEFSVYVANLPMAVARLSSSCSAAICYAFPVMLMTSCLHIMARHGL